MPTTPPAAPLIAEVLALCAVSPTTEVLGLVVDGDRVQPLRNCHPDPSAGFAVDPLEWARWEGGATVFFHSHPNGARWLSSVDQRSLPKHLECWVIGREGLTRFVYLHAQWFEIADEYRNA
jgi:proteasome lid subunit RPN8/RPN11